MLGVKAEGIIIITIIIIGKINYISRLSKHLSSHAF